MSHEPRFPTALNAAMNDIGWKQGDVARICGVSDATVSRLMQGAPPDPQKILKPLLAAVDLSVRAKLIRAALDDFMDIAGV